MANRNYQRGAYLERQVAEDLWQRGYEVVRAAGSKGAADVWASRVEDVDSYESADLLLVQAKSGKAKAGPAERRRLIEAARAAGGTPVLATRAGRGKLAYQAWHWDGDGSSLDSWGRPSDGDVLFGGKIRELSPKKPRARTKKGAEDRTSARPTD